MKISVRVDEMIRTMVVIFPLVLFSSIPAQSQAIDVGKFSSETVEKKLPSNWKPLTFKKIEQHTVYSLVKDEGTVVVKAISEASEYIVPTEFPARTCQ